MRRVISKKKADQMVIERKNFIYGSDDGDIPGCIKNGIDEQTAISIFDEINDFANLCFQQITRGGICICNVSDRIFKDVLSR